MPSREVSEVASSTRATGVAFLIPTRPATGEAIPAMVKVAKPWIEVAVPAWPPWPLSASASAQGEAAPAAGHEQPQAHQHRRDACALQRQDGRRGLHGEDREARQDPCGGEPPGEQRRHLNTGDQADGVAHEDERESTG